ncbi:MAG: hypothetical protein M3P24_04850 [Gemmatimonadota bacterium]|nr:hypothetical protein [Gemmatimonadota bacterium]
MSSNALRSTLVSGGAGFIDRTRLRSLGWEPRTPLEEGLRTTFEWIAAEGGGR